MKNGYWTPQREWDLQDVFLIGGGPSLANFNFDDLRGKNVIGCNDAYHLGGEIVKICAFGDAGWYHRNRKQLYDFTGRIVTNSPALATWKDETLLRMRRERDGIHKGEVCGWNYSTGAMAINLAISLGAMRVFLLGFDLNNLQGKSHWHDKNLRLTLERAFQRHLKGFNTIALTLPAGVDVVNITDGTSRIKCFRTMTFSKFHEYLKEGEEVAA